MVKSTFIELTELSIKHAAAAFSFVSFDYNFRDEYVFIRVPDIASNRVFDTGEPCRYLYLHHSQDMPANRVLSR
jgi:hypothetical protein